MFRKSVLAFLLLAATATFAGYVPSARPVITPRPVYVPRPSYAPRPTVTPRPAAPPPRTPPSRVTTGAAAAERSTIVPVYVPLLATNAARQGSSPAPAQKSEKRDATPLWWILSIAGTGIVAFAAGRFTAD